LGEWKITPELRIQAGRYPKLEYRVQYQESDYAFISRLLEEAGITFFFTHDGGGKTPEAQTRLVLSDDAQNAASIATVPFKDNPRKDINRNLLVVETRMEGGDGMAWTVHVESVYCDVQYRPLVRTQKPRVIGVQSAMVVGPSGEEIHTDEFGRIRVQFHWDR